jgi:uncharacterized protein YkwD
VSHRQSCAEPSFVPSVKVLPLLGLLAVVSVLTLAAPASARSTACANADVVVTAENRSKVSRAIRCLITQERTSRGLRALRPQAGLRIAARRYATTLVRRGEFDHVIPGVPDLTGRLRAAGYRTFVTAGENLAWAEGEIATARTVVQGWLDSPPHKENMLRAAYREVGIGVALGTPEGTQGITVTALFGRRR